MSKTRAEKRSPVSFTIFAIIHVDVASLTGVKDARDRFSALVFDIDQDRRTHRVEVPNVMRDVLEMASKLAGIEID